MKTLQAVVAVLVLFGFAGSSFAASKASRGKNSNQSEENKSEAKPDKDKGGKPDKNKEKMKFSAEEQRVIQDYVKGKRAKDLPPGLQRKMAKGGSLPPGWEKKVSPGQIMPPEVLKVATPLPPEIVAKLPPPPRGAITVTVEGKVVRLIQATHEILDVFEVGRRR